MSGRGRLRLSSRIALGGPLRNGEYASAHPSQPLFSAERDRGNRRLTEVCLRLESLVLASRMPVPRPLDHRLAVRLETGDALVRSPLLPSDRAARERLILRAGRGVEYGSVAPAMVDPVQIRV